MEVKFGKTLRPDVEAVCGIVWEGNIVTHIVTTHCVGGQQVKTPERRFLSIKTNNVLPAYG